MPKFASKYVGYAQAPENWLKVGNTAIDIDNQLGINGPFNPGIDPSYYSTGHIIISDTSNANLVGRTTGGGGSPTASANTPTYWATADKADVYFKNLVSKIAKQSFDTADAAKEWLDENNYWTTWESSNFVTIWDTTLGVNGDNPLIRLPLVEEGNYNFTVNWGDGNQNIITSWNQIDKDHLYAGHNTYTITISGTISGWRFNSTADCEKLIEVSNFGSLKISNLGHAFAGCSNLTRTSGILDLTGITDLTGLFMNCTSLAQVRRITDWNVSNITSFRDMFNGTLFNQSLNGWDTSSAITTRGMFRNASQFNKDLSLWNTSTVQDMSGMFSGTLFNQNISGWTVSNVTDMNTMFAGTPFNQNIGNWNVSNVTNMNAMFSSTPFNQNISNWNVSSVNNMGSMFADATDFNQNIGGWTVSNVTDMSFMFGGATSFNQNISGWNVSSVTTMSGMFVGASSFNQNISGWNVSNVTNMSAMFANSPFNQNIGGWVVSNVIDMTAVFSGATSFNQNIGNWDVSSVLSMNAMFYNAASFNQNIGGWTVSNVTDMASMFENATSFNQNIGSWNTSQVESMYAMFENATSFNQNISSWNISSVSEMSRFMLGKSTANFSYYDNLLNAWSLLSLQNGLIWDMGTIQYTSAGSTARTNIINNYSWTINDGGQI